MSAPTLDAIASEGVSAVKLQPAFPTTTFPNHFTLVTGLVPDHHGVVSNAMRDPAIPDVVFAMGNSAAVADPRWWQAEPIWTILEKQGRRTAPLLWPGASQVPFGGVRPSHWVQFRRDITSAERIALVADLFSKPQAEWPDFTTMYWPDVDAAGHTYGPDSREVTEAAERIDHALGQLRAKLRSTGALDSLNIIVVSDHGMSALSPDRVIYLSDYIDLSAIEIVDGPPTMGISPKTLTIDEIYGKFAGKHPQLEVYRKQDIPARFQYGTHPRVPPIVLMAADGWTIFPRRPVPLRFGGAHGYDNALDSMQGLFVASGPAFKQGVSVDLFRSVDIYGLMCAILGVPPAKNDGDSAAAKALLRDRRE
jgi:predicted AlkP superfamily pyrophosphatase or phosphodiesterase